MSDGGSDCWSSIITTFFLLADFLVLTIFSTGFFGGLPRFFGAGFGDSKGDIDSDLSSIILYISTINIFRWFFHTNPMTFPISQVLLNFKSHLLQYREIKTFQ
jgi:hypothetical protein